MRRRACDRPLAAEGRGGRPGAADGAADAGCTLGDVDRETQRFGLATPLAVVTQTGIAGLTLSGGMGWLRRKHGLSCDNVISAQVVFADGAVLTASESENPDLFWAIRVLGRTREADEIPAESHGEPYVARLGLHPGDRAEGERVLAPLRELGEPIADLSGPCPTPRPRRCSTRAIRRAGVTTASQSVNVSALTDEVIDRLAEHAAWAPSPHSTIDVWYQGGAIARVAEDETGFANRSAPYLLGVEANFEHEPDSAENLAWVRDVIADMREFSDGGLPQLPRLPRGGERLMREGYGENYERLAEVKTNYDPTNLFRLNANILPPR